MRTHGVPQGSILGPLLFVIYSADLLNLDLHSLAKSYADDTQLIYSFDPLDFNQAVAAVHEDLVLIFNWSKANGLLLNTKKTICILVDPSGRLDGLNYLPHCRLNNDEIPYVDSVKNLGAWIDNKWRFDVHVAKKCQAAYIRLKSLYKYRHSLSFSTKKLLVNTTVLSLFDYCDFVFNPCLNDL